MVGSVDSIDPLGSTVTNLIPDGRRIVELRLLAKQLDDGCQVCGVALRLSSCIGEKKYGLASILELECDTCGGTTNVSTCIAKSPYTTSVQKGRPAYDVNTKSALAILSSGIAVAQANKFLATLNVPPMSERSTKKREREIGLVVEQVAKKSCDAACVEE